ncbi:hypothetical protein GCM10025878_13830 [Leuconostoc gasicomitatum]|uniref:hypothetical protein n=1 Tax=Leuconostoc gasicomitatum TaxID=115778 RepID=UPI0001DB5794|nr:hypothetical protein [Leuconostoc gasicomitatum]GMA06312.1 hypothetical protein GCM10025878_13830 [Leuconostoc gasicomitatum]CBL92216.1 hypothetical protein LEGAS_1568 [Leuconostoc gasicomitatum LMG 18811]
MSALVIFLIGVVLFYTLLVASYAGKFRAYGVKAKFGKYIVGPCLMFKVGYSVSKKYETDQKKPYKKIKSEIHWAVMSMANFERDTAMFAVIIRTILLAKPAERKAFLDSVGGSVISNELGYKGNEKVRLADLFGQMKGSGMFSGISNGDFMQGQKIA